MHPEIEKFWKDAGYWIACDIIEDDLWIFYWTLMKGKFEVRVIGKSAPQEPGTKEAQCTILFWNGKNFSEKEMLKIVRNKMFL